MTGQDSHSVQYTMKDLVRLTGFSERQIRFYITRKLAPGAGTRGPNVAYSAETLRRLQLVARLKEMKVQPAGRSLTLDEISESIRTLGEDGAEAMLEGQVELSILDTEAQPLSSASDYVEEHYLGIREPEAEYGPGLDCFSPPARLMRASAPELPHSTPGVRDLLHNLRDLLAHLTNEHPQTSSGASRAENWARTRIPEIEIQVRVPDNAARRTQLEKFIHELDTLLAGEDST